jgi:hypothetical protein
MRSAPVYSNGNFANEVEFCADWNITDHIYFSAVARLSLSPGPHDR